MPSSPVLLSLCLVVALLALTADASRKQPHRRSLKSHSPKRHHSPTLPLSPPPYPPQPSPSPSLSRPAQGGIVPPFNGMLPPFNGTMLQNGPRPNGTMPGMLQNGGGFVPNGTMPGFPGAGAGAGPLTKHNLTSGANVTYEMEVGPYEVVAEETPAYNRSEVAEDQAGIPITFTLTVLDNGSPLQGARLDFWAANAQGLYSDESSIGTSGTDYLRGWQTTNSKGVVQFLSIFSGRYPGRTTHAHFRVRMFGATGNTTYDDTTQVYFPQDVADEILSVPAYVRPSSTVFTSNSEDRIYQLANQVNLTGSIAAGWFAATYTINLPLIPAK